MVLDMDGKESSNIIKVMIAEDHEIVRQGLKLIFLSSSEFEIVAEVSNGKQAVDRAGIVKPDVILMDVEMPVMDGIEATSILQKRYSDIKVIILTSDQSDETVMTAMASGANGYCLKDVSTERLFCGIRCIHQGDLWLDSSVAEVILKNSGKNEPGKVFAQGNGKKSGADVQSILSVRELEILALIVEGCSNGQIGKKLSISIDTVKIHIKHILEKLAVGGRTEAAVKAVREDLI